VACGSWHTLVMTADGGVWSCGWGHLGRLGLGDECEQSTFKRIDAHHFAGSSVRMVAAGEAHSVRKFPFNLTFGECERECECECA
jgi:alpha-tubulin suppressor-like RCC1 family protein